MAAFSPSTNTDQIKKAFAKTADQISIKYGSHLSLDQLSDLEDIMDEELSDAKAKEILDDAEQEGILADLVRQADAMGIAIGEEIESGWKVIDDATNRMDDEREAGLKNTGDFKGNIDDAEAARLFKQSGI